MNPLPLTDTDLNAYVDGALPPARAADVEQMLARDPAIATRVAEMRQQNGLLRELFDPWLADPIPAALVDAARAPTASIPWRRFAPYFAFAATLVLGVSSGWYLRDATLERGGTPTTFARQAALTHALYAGDVNRPVEIWAAEEKRLVAWLSRRLGFAVHAPDLNGAGFALVGGRLVAGNERPTALFMYENADKQRVLEFAAGYKAPKRNDRVWLIPGHCDPTFNLYDWIVGYRADVVETVWPIAARGALG